MSHYVLERRQVVPGDLLSVFGFFEDPRNLEQITPPWLRFAIVETTDPRVHLGTEIVYRLRWKGIPIRWRSRISEYERNVRFADEMVQGPYRRWYHRHLFEQVAGGVEIRDVVEYELPLGPLGDLVHAAVVGEELHSIFDYRARTVDAIFPVGSSVGGVEWRA